MRKKVFDGRTWPDGAGWIEDHIHRAEKRELFTRRMRTGFAPSTLLPNYDKLQDFQAVIDKVAGDPVAVVSKDYQLVQHTEFFLPCLDALQQMSFPVSKLIIKDSGARVDVEILPTELHRFDGQDIKLGFRLTNSFDGSVAARVQAYGMRVVFSNALIGRNLLGGITKFHVKENIRVKELPETMTGIISDAEENLGRAFHKGTSINVPKNRARMILEKKAKFGKRYRDKIIGAVDLDKYNGSLNRWHLYCASTYVIERRLEAEKINELTRERLHRKANRILLGG